MKKIMSLMLLFLVYGTDAQSISDFALLQVLNDSDYENTGILLSPDGRYLASWGASWTDKLTIRDLTGNTTMEQFSEGLQNISFSPDSLWLAFSDSQGELYLYHLESQSYLVLSEGKNIHNLVFSNNRLAAGNGTTITIFEFSLESGQIQYEMLVALEGNLFDMSVDGSYLLYAESEFEHSDLIFWDINTRQLERFQYLERSNLLNFGYFQDIRFAPDGQNAVIIAQNGVYRLQLPTLRLSLLDLDVDMTNYRIRHSWSLFTPDSQEVLLVFESQELSEVHLWNLENSADRTLLTVDQYLYDGTCFIAAYDSSVVCYYLTPREEETTLKIWHRDNDEVISRNFGALLGIAAHPTQAILAVHHYQGAIEIIDSQTWEILSNLSGMPIDIWSHLDFVDGGQVLGFTPDGNQLISFAGQLITRYGVPDEAHPALLFTLARGEISSSGINLRSMPSLDAPTLAYVAGTVVVGGLDPTEQFAYLPEYDGWVILGAPYLQVDNLEQLPVLSFPE